MPQFRLSCVVLSAALLALLTSTATAATVVLSASIDCAQADAGAGTCGSGGSGTGVASVSYDDQTNELSWLVSWQDLSAEVVNAHFHGPALPGANAGVEVGIDFQTNPAVGSATITSEQAADLLAGLWYVNIHSSAFPGGEIRGQVTLPAFQLSATLDCAQADAGAGTCGGGGSGSGAATVSYDDVSGVMAWDISWAGLSSMVVNAHFHGPALPNENAGVEVGIDFQSNPAIGAAVITSEQATDLLAGLWYVNIHSSGFPAGEIRGQVTLPEAPFQLSASIDCAQADAGAGTCGSGGTGTGIASVSYYDETGLLTWNVSWEGLSSPVVNAHFHGPALPDQNAGVEVGIDFQTNPAVGSATITSEQADDLLAGLWYVNIHSKTFPGGEIRGQVLLPEAPFQLSASLDCEQADAGAGTCGSGGTGTGVASVSYYDETGLLTWNVSWEGLSSLVVNAHFHGPALPSQNAGVQVGIDFQSNPAVGSATITPEQADDLLAGLWYVNIHSKGFPAGEIRGQVRLPRPPVQLSSSIDCAQADAGAGTCGSGGSGTGLASVTYDDATKQLAWSVSWEGLSSTVVNAHFHGPAQPDENAGVQVGIDFQENPAIGTATITSQQADDLLAGLWYVNIHSESFPAGEIRGQVTVPFQLSASLDCAQADAGIGTCGGGGTGTGSAVASYDDATSVFAWNVSWEGLSSMVVNAHFHGPAQPDENAGVQVGIDFQMNPSLGAALVSQEQANELVAGLWYVNIHSSDFPAGEIRGQVPEPASSLLAVSALVALAGLARRRRRDNR
jgi:hypothetical protein